MPSDVSANNKRIAKNTMFLYFRMGISMLVGLYTSRIVLEALGVENYGIYNVVGSFIVAFTFISGPLGTATQRFLNFELGKDSEGRLNKVFNLSFFTYLVLAAVLVCVIEVAGYWFLTYKMQMPPERSNAAYFAFHMSVLTLVVNLIRTPFDALIIAYERMSFYAYISIADVLLKLLNAFLLLYISFDKLKVYSLNMLVISAIVLVVTFIYIKRNFKAVKIQQPQYNWEKNLFKEIMSFSGWSLFSAVASMTATHGVNILINTFFGVVVNAAMGIAVQVSSIVAQFAHNFQKAFNPQIVKLYAAGNLTQMHSLICSSSKFSFLLLFFFICPLIFNMNFILHLWLGRVPNQASIFCSYMLIWTLLESLMAPMWTAINATGKIKYYHLTMNPIILSVILFSFIAFKLGMSAYYAVIIKCIVDVILVGARLFFLKKLISFNVMSFVKKTLKPVCCISLCAAFVCYCTQFVKLKNDFWSFGINMLVFVTIYSLLIWLIGLESIEKNVAKNYIRRLYERIWNTRDST